MDKTSTQSHPLHNIESAEPSPSEFILESIRQFARVYTSFPQTTQFGGFVLN